MHIDISLPNQKLSEEINHKINFKTKPIGSLGILEALAQKICLIQQTLDPKLTQPTILVFAADHGLANDGVSAYPQEVTYQMVLNFLSGGAGINVFSNQNGINLQIIDAGVNYIFEETKGLTNAKLGMGTESSLHQKAMTKEQFENGIKKGTAISNSAHSQGINVIGFGEMGIGNTSSASLIMSHICKIPIQECVGRGTGVDDKGLARKVETLKKVQEKHSSINSTQELLEAVGGFEIVMMCGAMLQAASNKMIVLVDGFIATAAYLCAKSVNPNIAHYSIFCHQSDESGHKKMLSHLKEKPLLNLGLRLGEGTGCALAYPIVQSSVSFMNNMASFESANVSNKE